MGRVCVMCQRGTQVGMNVPSKGLLRKKGGGGRHRGTQTKRTFKINLVNTHIFIDQEKKRVRMCTRCLKSVHQPNQKTTFFDIQAKPY